MIAVMFVCQSCDSEDTDSVPAITNRAAMPILKSNAVSTLISDSGIISYKIIAEEWYVYDQATPSYWSFEKGLFVEKFDRSFHVEAFVSCDTAYFYDQEQLWELRGRVVAKNVKNETFKTSLLYWDQRARRFYSDRYMEIDGIDQDLSGYDFSSNEQMTEYSIHRSQGAFPLADQEPETPTPSDSAIVVPTLSTTTLSTSATPE